MERMTSSERGDIVPGLMWCDEKGNSGPIRATDIPLEDPKKPGSYKVKIDGEMKDVVRVTPDVTDTRPTKNTVSIDVQPDVAKTELTAAVDVGLPKLTGVFGGKDSSSIGETTRESLATTAGAGKTDLDVDNKDENADYLDIDIPENKIDAEDEDDTPEDEPTVRRKRKMGAKALAIVGGAGVGLVGLYGVSVAGTSHVTEGTMSPSVKDFVIDLIPGNDK